MACFREQAIGVINIQNLCFPEVVSSPNQAPIVSISAPKKRRHRHALLRFPDVLNLTFVDIFSEFNEFNARIKLYFRIICQLQFAWFKYTSLAPQMNGVISLALGKCARSESRNHGRKLNKKKTERKLKRCGSYTIKYLLTELCRAGRENIWLSVMATDLAPLGPYAMTSIQLFSCPALPLSQ